MLGYGRRLEKGPRNMNRTSCSQRARLRDLPRTFPGLDRTSPGLSRTFPGLSRTFLDLAGLFWTFRRGTAFDCFPAINEPQKTPGRIGTYWCRIATYWRRIAIYWRRIAIYWCRTAIYWCRTSSPAHVGNGRPTRGRPSIARLSIAGRIIYPRRAPNALALGVPSMVVGSAAHC